MKTAKILGIILLIYVGIVAGFESMLGYFQPQAGSTMVITTLDEQNQRHSRVVARLENLGQLYAAANHWPRAWYHQALANPVVQVTFQGETHTYRVKPVSGPEHEQIAAGKPLGLGLRILTGFPPRKFLRLEEIPG